MISILDAVTKVLAEIKDDKKEVREKAERWHKEDEAKWNRHEEDGEGKRVQLEMERDARETIARIPTMTSNDEVELYIQSLENELQQANYPRHKWKAALTSRLTPAAKDFVTDLQADPMSDFSDFKERLLDCCGLTAAQAGFTYHKLKVKDLKTRTTAQVIQ